MLITVADRMDGSGLTVTAEDSDGGLLTAEVMESSGVGGWRDSSTRTGDGALVIGIGSTPDKITTDRAYFIRVRDGAGYSNTVAGQPTLGFPSPSWELIMQAKRVVLSMNLAKIGGNVHHCLDPLGAIKTSIALPAVLIYQSTVKPDVMKPVDNLDFEVGIPIEVGVAESNDNDWIAGLEWWLWIRWQIFRRFNRKPIDLDGETHGGRIWNAEFGLITLPSNQAFDFRFQSVILNAKYENLTGE